MSKFIIEGPAVISGEIEMQGAKNSVLALMSAALLTDKEVILENCPDISDVKSAAEILQNIGCSVILEDKNLIINAGALSNYIIPDRLMRKMRSSVIFLGAMLARSGHAVISCPGGCELGPRPIDLHLSALSKMGVKFTEENGEIIAVANRLHGAEIHLDFPSVGATENTILAATLAEGTTRIHNAAREPEIVDLQNLLNTMGAKVCGAGTSTVEIVGVKRLDGAQYRIMPDRIVTATYLTMAAMTAGKIRINGVCVEDLISVKNILQRSGAEIFVNGGSIELHGKQRYKSMGTVRTLPYPGFPTDALASIMAYASAADGLTIFVENIFQNRFKQAGELVRMGAKIKCEGRVALVEGVTRLFGADLVATDLRGGAALVTAALRAEGPTVIDKAEFIERGYDDMVGTLQKLGVNIRKEM